MVPEKKYPLDGWRARLHEIIFEADTPAGKTFDVLLIITILLSVIAVMLDSVAGVRIRHGKLFYYAEWVFTILFTIEYFFRLICVARPWKYATSFFGVIDLLAVIPTYLSLLVAGTHYLLVVRVLRVLRVFRVLKLAQYVQESNVLMQVMRGSRRKITIFLSTIFTLVVIMGSFMYLIEGGANGFTSIPRSIYWAIVTITTVGYGDITPQTVLGQLIASFIMVLGYSIIAVPTGIVTAEFSQYYQMQKVSTQACPTCSSEGHSPNAKYCQDCGGKM